MNENLIESTINSKLESNPFKKANSYNSEFSKFSENLNNDSSNLNSINLNVNLHDKYKPNCINDLQFHSQEVSEIVGWLNSYDKHSVTNKAIYLTGINGIGKTSYIRAILSELKYHIVEFNYNDSTRNVGMKEFLNKHLKNNINVFFKNYNKTAIIIDELENIITYNSNYIKELISFINPIKGKTGLKKEEKDRLKKQYFGPIICICNSRSASKFKDLAKECFQVKFKSIPKIYIEKFAKSILSKESIRLNKVTFDQIISIANGNISQLLCIIQYILLNKSEYIQSNKLLTLNEVSSIKNQSNQLKIDSNQSKNDSNDSNEIISKNKLESKLNEELLNSMQESWKVDCDSTIFENMNTLLKNSKTISIDSCHRIYELDTTLIPTMINDNCIEYTETLDELTDVLDNFSNFDVVNAHIYSTQCWGMYNIASLYSTVLPIRKMGSKNCIDPSNWQLRFCEQSNKIFQKAQMEKKLNKLSTITKNDNVLDLYHWSNVLYQKLNQFITNDQIEQFKIFLKGSYIVTEDITEKDLQETSNSIKLTIDDLKVIQPLFKNLKTFLDKPEAIPKITKVPKATNVPKVSKTTAKKTATPKVPKEPKVPKVPKTTAKKIATPKVPKKQVKNKVINEVPEKLEVNEVPEKLEVNYVNEIKEIHEKLEVNEVTNNQEVIPEKLEIKLQTNSDDEMMDEIMNLL